MQLSPDEINTYLPFYLTSDQKTALVEAIEQFPVCNYYSRIDDPDPLQGDGWSGVEIFHFEDGAKRSVKGLVLSNSCDIDPNNTRDLAAKINFAPIVKLNALAQQLKAQGMSDRQLSDKIASIRKQAITTLFYLPAGTGLSEEYVALLFDVHSVPLQYFVQRTEKARLFSLSQVGFYIFVMKLTIHFCRMHERVDRNALG